MTRKLPHFQVYARIARSEIHGVGVKAIRPIKEGTYVFYGDDSRLRWIESSEISNLPRQLRKMYEDFCIKKRNKYGCPKNFNLMTPAWYLNHSTSPNLAADSTYRFFALRDIRINEELTVNYGSYSAVSRRHLKGKTSTRRI